MTYLARLTALMLAFAPAAHAQLAETLEPLIPSAAPPATAEAHPTPAPVMTAPSASEAIDAAKPNTPVVAAPAEPAAEVAVTPPPPPALSEAQAASPAMPQAQLAPAAGQAMPNFGSEGYGAIPALPLEIMTNGRVTYVSGGVGDEELQMLKDRAGEFNVHLLLSATNGDFIGGTLVRVLDAQGAEVLQVPDAGPYLYMKLPPGAYTLEATATQGGIKSTKVKAPATGSTRAHLAFIE